jgi:hypothetical protein
MGPHALYISAKGVFGQIVSECEGGNSQFTEELRGIDEEWHPENKIQILSEIIEGYVEYLSIPSHSVRMATIGRAFVSVQRISELSALPSVKFDTRRLIQMLDELNICFGSGCNLSVALLTRAILDHVPPVFGKANFGEVANNHSAGRSFRDAMLNLDNLSRKIADTYLHRQIRREESLPTAVQVDFSQALDLLLGEIVCVLRAERLAV